MVVEYMDSDEEKKEEEEVEVEIIEEVEEKEEEEEQYTFPPIQEWIPVEKAQCFTFLSFRPVQLPSSGVAHNEVPVRSTIQGKFGRSVIIGPPPKVLEWVGRHSSSTMMMVTPDQLRAHLHRQAHTFNNRSAGPRRKIQRDQLNPLGQMTDKGLGYELQAAVTPWVGNLLIPPKHKLTAADALRERGKKTPLPSTPIFLLLLQTMNVDAMGCKEMIEQRRNKVVSLAPPPPRPSARPTTVAGMLQQRKVIKEKEQLFDLQHKLILKQLQDLQQREKQKQQLLKQRVHTQQLVMLQQPPPPLPPLRPPSMPPQNLPGILLQMPPNMHPQMSFPQAVFIRHPATPASSIQLINTPSSLNTPPPAAGVITSTLPAHPVSVIPMPLNATSTCPASSPLTENLKAPLPRPPNVHVSLDATPPSQNAAPSPSPSRSRSTKRRGKKVAKDQEAVCSSQSKVPLPRPPNERVSLDPPPTSQNAAPSLRPSHSISRLTKRRGKKVVEDQKAVCSSQSGAGNGAGGACTGVDETGDGVVKDGRRVRKPTQKAKALQEASEAKVTAFS